MNCASCSREFIPNTKSHKFCNKRCRYFSENSKAGAQFKRANTAMISSATKGAIQELRVSMDLMNKGFHVFRALSPACPCDLIAFKDKDIHMIEVKSGIRLKSGKVFYPHSKKEGVCYAVGLHDDIYYSKVLQ